MPRSFGRVRRGPTRLAATVSLVSTLALGLGTTACSPDTDIVGPGPESGGPPGELLESAIHVKVNLETGRVDVMPLTHGRADRVNGLAPSFALLGKNEVGTSASSFSRTPIGLGKVRIRFDLRLTNKLAHSDLVTPTFTTPPAGVTGVLLFPFKTVALDAAGHPLPLAELRAQPSVDWNGTGSPGSGAPHNFFNSSSCLPVIGDDCFRWESFGTPIAAGATTSAHTVGFDTDALVASLDVYVLLAADIRENILTGAIGGTITSTLFGPLEDALVTATPGGETGTSDGSGNYLIGGLTPGSRTVAVSAMPSSCFRPAPRTVSVVAGTTTDADFALSCRPILYARFLGSGEYEVYSIKADGTGQTRITNDDALNVDPAWSPDGTRVAYNAGGDIAIINADGTGQHPITSGSGQDAEPAWSWDGSKIAFVRFIVGGNTDIWVINADGTGLTQITTTNGFERDPSWSPDGSKLVFQLAGDIYVMPATGGAQTKLTTNPFGDGYPAWSPDGSKIAYVATSEADDGEGSADHLYEVFTMNPDGSGKAQVTHDDFFDLQPAWSPDGSTLVYSSYAPVTPRLFTVAATGGTSTALTPAGQDGEAPAW